VEFAIESVHPAAAIPGGRSGWSIAVDLPAAMNGNTSVLGRRPSETQYRQLL